MTEENYKICLGISLNGAQKAYKEFAKLYPKEFGEFLKKRKSSWFRETVDKYSKNHYENPQLVEELLRASFQELLDRCDENIKPHVLGIMWDMGVN